MSHEGSVQGKATSFPGAGKGVEQGIIGGGESTGADGQVLVDFLKTQSFLFFDFFTGNISCVCMRLIIPLRVDLSELSLFLGTCSGK